MRRRLAMLGLFVFLFGTGRASAQAVNTNLLCTGTAVVTDAQIRLLPTTPKVILAATETLNYMGLATQIPFLQFAYAQWTIADPLTNVAASNFYVIDIGSDDSSTYSSPVTYSNSPQNGDAMFFVPRTYTRAADGDPNRSNSNGYLDGLLDNALVIRALNGASGNYTGGNGNSLTVSFLYAIFNTTTGAFVACP